MRIEIAEQLCCGSGMCALTAPEVFDQDDDHGTVVLLDAEPPAGCHPAVREAAHRCPCTAITVHESG
ncbi:ferredoxin [Kitasatospora sp. NPDC052896]|uniref:ferredoxin n=1 Tax=Kitasatospora sp. NPDC052896 TaxID=3364061 RepID=UPI0037C97426